jgi:predicted AlkP superfamily pyrophosphatase or phosphodiesterase
MKKAQHCWAYFVIRAELLQTVNELLKVALFAVAVVLRDDVGAFALIEEFDRFEQSLLGFVFFIRGDRDFDFLLGGANLGFESRILLVGEFVGLVTFDLGFDVCHKLFFFLTVCGLYISL